MDGRQARRAVLSVLASALAASLSAPPRAEAQPGLGRTSRRCPEEMALVRGVCIDRWEASFVDMATGQPLSPYYSPVRSEMEAAYEYWLLERTNVGDDAARQVPLPEPSAWQRGHTFNPRAVSRPGAIPQGYLSYYTAKRACTNAGKRLCTEHEWLTACEGERALKFPYGEHYRAFACNVFRPYHPGFALHQNSSTGHRDPRLNLVVEGEDQPLLRPTGDTPACKSNWGGDAVFDMVGNLDEWVEGEKRPVFVGGFYSRSTNKGCEARVDSHAAAYYDYSLGTRCCADPAPLAAPPPKPTPAPAASHGPAPVPAPVPAASRPAPAAPSAPRPAPAATPIVPAPTPAPAPTRNPAVPPAPARVVPPVPRPSPTHS
jgi:sulfatase modifying factor 1